LFSQLRSPGLFYSSAILGAFLTLIISFRWSRNFKKCTLYDYILIATILFSMNKTVLVFMCVLILLCLVYSSSQERKALYHIASIIIIGMIFMIILFPGAVSNRFTLDAFKSSGGIRILDFLISLNIKQLMDPDDLLDVYSTKYQDESEIGNLSGISQYFIFIPLVLLILIFKKNKADSVLMKKNIKFFIIITIACIFNMFSHPIMLNKTLAFLLGPYFLVIKNFFVMKRSVPSSSPLPGASVHPTT